MNYKNQVFILACAVAVAFHPSAAEMPANQKSISSTGKPVNLIEGDSSAETEVKSVTTGSWGGTPSLEWDDTTAFDGKRSVKILRYPGCPHLKAYFSPGTASVNDVKNLKPGQTYTYSFYAKAEKEGTKALIGGAQFMWKQYFPEKTILLGKEWQRYSITFVPKEDIQGEDNRYCLFYGLKEDGVAWFDAFQLQEGGVATEYANATPFAVGLIVRNKDRNTFLADEKKLIDINVRNTQSNSPRVLKVKYEIEDYTGKTIREGVATTAFNDDGNWKYTIDFDPGKLGYYLVRAELLDEDQLLAQARSSLVIVAPPVKLANGIAPWCGVSVSHDPVLSPLKKIGVRWLEQWIKWDSIEKIQGEYNWDGQVTELKGGTLITGFLKEARQQGFKMKVMFRGFPGWSLDPKEKEEAEKLGKGNGERLLCDDSHLPDWRRFVRDCLGKYKEYIDLYEIGAEADAFLGLNPYYQKKSANSMIKCFAGGEMIEDYADIIKIAAEEIRAQVPNALIGAVRPSDCDVTTFHYTFPFTAEIIKRTSAIDFNVLPLDPYARPRYIGPAYPVSGDPLELRNVYDGAQKLIKELGDKQKEVYISEQGYFIDYREIYNPKYTSEQIRYLVQSYLVARASGFSRYCWFTSQANPNTLEGKYYYAGMWLKDEPLPEVAAYSAVARIVENVTEARLLDLSDNVKAAVFRKADGKAVAAIWTTENPSGIYMGQGLRCSDVMGNPVAAENLHGQARFALSSFPVYLWKSGSKDNFSELSKMLKQARLDVKEPVEVSFRASSDEVGKMYLSNQLRTQPLSGKVDYSIDGRVQTADFDIPAAGKYIVDLDISGKNTRGRTMDVQISFSDGLKSQHVSFDIPDFIYVPELTSIPRLDADPKDWRVEPVISMEDRSFIFPPDPHTPWNGNDDLSVKIYLGWKDSYLYLIAEVKDDIHSAKNPTQLYNADSLQIAFDPKNDASLAKAEGYAPDDIELAMALTPSGPVIEATSGKDICKESEFLVSRDEQNKTTRYSARFPLASLGVAAGKAFGLNAVVFDDDSGTGQSYYMQFTRGIAEKKNPKLFSKFILTNNRK